MRNSLFSKSKTDSWYQSLLVRYGRYFDGGSYRFVKSHADNHIELQPAQQTNRQLLILLVGRQHYSEVVRSYPLEQANEVRKLIRLEYEGQRYHYRIARKDKGKTYVNVWVFDADLPQSLLTIPESVLLTATTSPRCVLQADKPAISGVSPGPVYAIQASGLIYSQQDSIMRASAEAFAMAVGVAPEEPTTSSTGSEFAGRLFDGLRGCGLSLCKIFWRLPEVKAHKRGEFLKSLLLPGAAVVLLYLGASSVWLIGKHWYLQQQLESQSTDLQQAFNVQDKLAQQRNTYEQLMQYLSSQQNIANVWYLMADLFEHADFSRMAYEQGRIVLAGSTVKATDLMDLITNHPVVADARFDSPTRTSRNEERFVISFALEQPQKQIKLPQEGSDEQ